MRLSQFAEDILDLVLEKPEIGCVAVGHVWLLKFYFGESCTRTIRMFRNALPYSLALSDTALPLSDSETNAGAESKSHIESLPTVEVLHTVARLEIAIDSLSATVPPRSVDAHGDEESDIHCLILNFTVHSISISAENPLAHFIGGDTVRRRRRRKSDKEAWWREKGGHHRSPILFVVPLSSSPSCPYLPRGS